MSDRRRTVLESPELNIQEAYQRELGEKANGTKGLGAGKSDAPPPFLKKLQRQLWAARVIALRIAVNSEREYQLGTLSLHEVARARGVVEGVDMARKVLGVE